MITQARPVPAFLRGTGAAVPENRVPVPQIVAGLQRVFSEEDPELIRALVENSGVEWRHFVLAPEELLAPSDFTARNQLFQRAAPRLAAQAARQALDRSGVLPEAVDAVVDVSCTGISLPALDVTLAQDLGLRTDCLRVPITESGCAAGALALGLASRLATTGMTVLAVAVELCSLTLLHQDRSRANLVSSVLFGDGAAAAVVGPGRGPLRYVGSGSHLFPATEYALGFDVGSFGMRIVLDRALPRLIRQGMAGVLDECLARFGRQSSDVGLHLLHPGGRRIMDAYADIFGLDEEELRLSRECLRRFGNLSSASVLTVLDLALQSGKGPHGDRDVLLTAFGPGLSVEMNLFTWEGAA